MLRSCNELLTDRHRAATRWLATTGLGHSISQHSPTSISRVWLVCLANLLRSDAWSCLYCFIMLV